MMFWVIRFVDNLENFVDFLCKSCLYFVDNLLTGKESGYFTGGHFSAGFGYIMSAWGLAVPVAAGRLRSLR